MIEVRSIPEFDNSYIDAMEVSMCFIEDEANSILLEAAMMELQMFTDASVSGKLVLTTEEVNLGDLAKKKITERHVEGAWEHIKYFFEKVIKFLDDAVTKFLDTALNIFQSYEEWFNQNKPKIDPASMNPEVLQNLSFDVIPYFNHSAFERLNNVNTVQGIDSIDTMIEKFKRDPKIQQEGKTAEYINQTYFKPLYEIDNKDPKRAALLYWRGFDRDISDFAQKRFAGAAGDASAKTALEKMIKYCANYKTFVNSAKIMVDRTKKELEKAKNRADAKERRANRMVDNNENTEYKNKLARNQNVFDKQKQNAAEIAAEKKKAARESYIFDDEMYSILEGASLYDVDNLGFEIVTEVAAVTSKYNDPGKAEPKTKAEQAAVKQQKDDETKNFVEKKAYANKKSGIANELVGLCKIHNTIATARLSVTEEIFKHYVKVMQDIVAALDNLDAKSKTDQENRDYNQGKIDEKERKHEERMADQQRRIDEAKQRKGVIRNAWDSLFSKDRGR